MEDKRKIITRLRPIDDMFMEKLFESKEVCEEVLRTILEMPDLKVVKVTPQNSIRNLQGRSVRLDALCKREDGSYCNIEVQKQNKENHIKRVRYNTSCITANITEPGEKFEKVPDVYMIYITNFDIFKGKKTVYHVDSIIRETGEMVENGLHEIYVNTKVDDGSTIAELMKCFKQTEVNHKKFPRLSERIKYFKQDEEGVTNYK